MHFAIAGGHSAKARGASGYIDEYEKDRALVAHLIEELRRRGQTVTDCSNEEKTVMGELKAEVRAANSSGAELFLAVHFNAGGGRGSECWYCKGNVASQTDAERLSAACAGALGLPDRGAKPTTSLYVINNTSMPALLLEVCFVDTLSDCQAWWETPWEPLITALADALCTGTDHPTVNPEPGTPKLEIDGYFGSATVSALQEYLGTTVDGVVSGQDYRDMAAIGGRPTGAWQLGKGGSKMVTALQRKIGASQDGYFGSNTCKALQKHLGTSVDGVVSKPSQMVMELQRRLNDKTF